MKFCHGAGRSTQNMGGDNYILWCVRGQARENRRISFGDFYKNGAAFSVILHNEKNSKEVEKKP